MKVGVLISGRGSNMDALINACRNEDFPARIVCVLSNKAEAPGLQIAEQDNVPTHVVDHRQFESREDFDAQVTKILRSYEVDVVCLAGFMRILSSAFVSDWHNRLLNIHPSLLPAFKGLHVHERVLEAGVRFTGCTVHFVRPEMDEGPIIVQSAVPVMPDDTPDSLARRVLNTEHRCYPHALKLMAEGKLEIVGETVTVHGQSQLSVGAVPATINPPDK